MQEENRHNLFFGLEVSAPWQEPLPSGRALPEEARHLTLAFLGKVSKEKLLSELPTLPLPSSSLAPAGICDALLLLPEKDPRVVAYNVEWLTQKGELRTYRQALYAHLLSLGYPLDERPFLSHITLARAPFNEKGWRKHFVKIPLSAGNLHLYESVGNLTYTPLWTHPLTPPFIELSHTGEAAFTICGKDPAEIYLNAQLALAFDYPPFLNHLSEGFPSSLVEIVIGLNEKIAQLDQAGGSPFKAVSFHGELKEEENHLCWEMIVDV